MSIERSLQFGQMKYGTSRGYGSASGYCFVSRSSESPCRVSLLLGQEALGVEGGHAARSGGGHGLSVDVVLHVARCEDARDVGARRAGLGREVAGFVVIQPVEEERRVRVVP